MITAGLRLVRKAALFVTALSILPPGLADVWIVDASGNGDFLEIQDAIDVAVDGDVVIVRSGSYLGFTIDDESLDSTSVARILDSELTGGDGGGNCPPGDDVNGPNVEFLSGAAKQMSVDRRLARAGDLVGVSFDGAPFDEVVLAISARSSFHYQALSRGVLLLGGERRVILAGFLDASGHWDATIVAQGPAHDDDSMTVHLQALLKDAAGVRTLTNPAQLTVIR